mmetsp:Transcript_30785/g.42640  ORF Transcript_30785/g.42640 Transcript_30785/m.42640 type:complete len:296 (-) Transcript_30785:252-1139(-)
MFDRLKTQTHKPHSLSYFARKLIEMIHGVCLGFSSFVFDYCFCIFLKLTKQFASGLIVNDVNEIKYINPDGTLNGEQNQTDQVRIPVRLIKQGSTKHAKYESVLVDHQHHGQPVIGVGLVRMEVALQHHGNEGHHGGVEQAVTFVHNFNHDDKRGLNQSAENLVALPPVKLVLKQSGERIEIHGQSLVAVQQVDHPHTTVASVAKTQLSYWNHWELEKSLLCVVRHHGAVALPTLVLLYLEIRKITRALPGTLVDQLLDKKTQRNVIMTDVQSLICITPRNLSCFNILKMIRVFF